MVVRPSGRSSGRTEKNIPVRKERGERAPEAVPLIIDLQPVAMRERAATHRQVKIRLLGSAKVDYGLAPALDVGLRRSRRSRCAQQEDIHLVQSPGIEVRLDLLHFGALLGKRID